jgi:hypothetical protein
MRKLRPVEVAALVSGIVIGTGMAIGSGNAQADENPPPDELETITVTGTVDPAPQFTFTPGEITPPAIPDLVGTNPIPTQTSQLHAIKCGQAYSFGPQPGWSTYITTGYAWTRGFTIITSPTNTPPAGTGWQLTYGETTPWTGNPINRGTTSIFLGSIAANGDPGLLVNTLAHEWYHQLGATEAQAEAYGNSVEAAYKKDKGAKCGGL